MDRELLDNVRRYLNGYCTLQDLEAWVLSNLQKILDSGDEAAIEAANHIDGDLVELGEGLIDEATLREHLQSLLSIRDTIPVDFQEIALDTMSHATVAAETVRNSFQDPRPTVEIRLNHVFA